MTPEHGIVALWEPESGTGWYTVLRAISGDQKTLPHSWGYYKMRSADVLTEVFPCFGGDNQSLSPISVVFKSAFWYDMDMIRFSMIIDRKWHYTFDYLFRSIIHPFITTINGHQSLVLPWSFPFGLWCCGGPNTDRKPYGSTGSDLFKGERIGFPGVGIFAQCLVKSISTLGNKGNRQNISPANSQYRALICNVL